MKKLLALLSAGMLVAMWSGCGITDPTSSVTISIDGVGAVVIGGAAGQVTGKITTDSVLTNVTMKVLTTADVDVTSNFTINFTSGYSGKASADLKDDMSTTVAAKSTATAGTYKLSITAEAGSMTQTGTKEFTVTGTGGTDITSADVTIGSYDNATYGSSIDLDNGTVLKAADAVKDNSGVDICGTYSTKAGSVGFRIFNPVYAKSSSNITAFAGWINPAATSFHKVTVDFASITKVEQIEPLYVAASAIDFAIVQVGDVYVVKTSANKFALIKIVSFESLVTGSAVIKYGK